MSVSACSPKADMDWYCTMFCTQSRVGIRCTAYKYYEWKFNIFLYWCSSIIAFMSEHKDRTFVGAIKGNISNKTVIEI